jgi:hypothetical protein
LSTFIYNYFYEKKFLDLCPQKLDLCPQKIKYDLKKMCYNIFDGGALCLIVLYADQNLPQIADGRSRVLSRVASVDFITMIQSLGVRHIPDITESIGDHILFSLKNSFFQKFLQK